MTAGPQHQRGGPRRVLRSTITMHCKNSRVATAANYNSRARVEHAAVRYVWLNVSHRLSQIQLVTQFFKVDQTISRDAMFCGDTQINPAGAHELVYGTLVLAHVGGVGAFVERDVCIVPMLTALNAFHIAATNGIDRHCHEPLSPLRSHPPP